MRSAGCLVWRYGSHEPEVLLVHRPRLMDWSFPKGKLDRGECAFTAAVREVEEETGLRVTLGPMLPQQHYTVNAGQPKVVHYWAARAPEHADITTYRPNDEIDDVRWMPLTKACAKLTYPHDARLLEDFAASSFESSPLLVVRHGVALSRRSWPGEESDRPLSAEGKAQARTLVPVMAAYGVQRVVSSDATRCVDTVLPFVNSAAVGLRLDSALSQEEMDEASLRRRMQRLLSSPRRIAVCSHRPVFPAIFAALGVEAIPLDPGGVVVLHRADGKVVGVDTLAA